MSGEAAYDRLGQGYAAARREDPRIAAAIHAALGDARTVLNVGAGTGSYEPRDRHVTAVEPSPTMIAQRPPGSPPVVQAAAEALPFADGAFDAVMAVLTLHHWSDVARGLAELRRVAPRRVVLSADPALTQDYWLLADYFADLAPADAATFPRPAEIAAALGGRTRIETVPVPHDCADGFLGAYWRRPEAYLDPRVAAGISFLAGLDPSLRDERLGRLADDLRVGRWHERHADLLGREELDLGYRLVVSEEPMAPAYRAR